MSADDEAFIPYLVLVRFDKGGGDLRGVWRSLCRLSRTH
jgi:hypothetical protein